MTREEIDAIRVRASSHGRYLRENEFDGAEEITADALREATVDIDALLAEVERLSDEQLTAELERPSWEEGKWWKVLDSEGQLLAETSDEEEAREVASRYGRPLFRSWVRREMEWRRHD